MNAENYIVPHANFTEKPDDYELKVLLPGIAKDDAELHLENRTLNLKTHSKYQPPAGFKQVISEFGRPNYALNAELPEMADTSSLQAKLENGVLRVTVRKRPETQAKRIAIA